MDNLLYPFTVMYDKPNDATWQGFNCMAEGSNHAEDLCMNARPDCSIIWVNEGHNVMTMD